MDTSSPAVFVNAEILKMYLGKRVRTVIQVLRNDAGNIIGQSPDGHQLTIKGSQGLPLSHFVEVIGIADSNQSIRAEISTDFGSVFVGPVCTGKSGEILLGLLDCITGPVRTGTILANRARSRCPLRLLKASNEAFAAFMFQPLL